MRIHSTAYLFFLCCCLSSWLGVLTYIWISVSTPLQLLIISLIATTHLHLLKTLVLIPQFPVLHPSRS